MTYTVTVENLDQAVPISDIKLFVDMKNNLPHGIYIIEVLAGNKKLLQQKLEKL